MQTVYKYHKNVYLDQTRHIFKIAICVKYVILSNINESSIKHANVTDGSHEALPTVQISMTALNFTFWKHTDHGGQGINN